VKALISKGTNAMLIALNLGPGLKGPPRTKPLKAKLKKAPTSPDAISPGCPKVVNGSALTALFLGPIDARGLPTKLNSAHAFLRTEP